MKDGTLREALGGGDRRSIGNAGHLGNLAATNASLFSAMIDAMLDNDPLIRMRAADAAEKASRLHPELLVDHKTTLLGPVARIAQQEVRWHLLQMLPRLSLAPDERAQSFELAASWIDSKSRIVAAEALSAMFALAGADVSLQEQAGAAARHSLKASSASLRARARKLLKLV